MDSILQMHSITKRFPGIRALDKVSFDLYAGEVHALVGENGAGKSTLANVLCGALRADGGEINVVGKTFSTMNPDLARQMGIFVVQQHGTLIPILSIAENIVFGQYPTKKNRALVDWNAAEKIAKDVLDQIGFMDIDVTQRVIDISLAEQQKIEIAKAVFHDPRILILDEPSAVLPKNDIAILHRLIERLKEKKVGIVYISHNLNEILEISDRITVLKDGRKVTDLMASDTSPENLVRLMVGRELEELYAPRDHELGETAVQVENLTTKRVTDINLQIRHGEILGIAGLVGAGRTEVCRALFGLDPIRQGKITIDGREVRIAGPDDAIRNGIGFVTEDRHRTGLVLPMSLRSNVSLVGRKKITKYGMINHDQDSKVATEYVQRLNIAAHSIEQLVEFLSGGNQQKVVLAKWLFNGPSILLLDEPTRGIDVGSKAEVYAIMRELARRGICIVMVSSELPEILGMSDRIVVMCKSRVVGEFLPDETSEEEIIACASGMFGLCKNNRLTPPEDFGR